MKFIHMEEMMGQVDNARQLFTRWLAYDPDHHAYRACVKFELRHNAPERARETYETYVAKLPGSKSYLSYAKFEARQHNVASARAIYERAIELLSDDDTYDETSKDLMDLYVHFAEFEEHKKETERARAIFKHALDQLLANQTGSRDETPLYQAYLEFEKRNGGRRDVDGAVMHKRSQAYEERLKEDPLDYDQWFDYIRLLEEGVADDLAELREDIRFEEESGANGASVALAARVDELLAPVRDVYERAIANLPLKAEKSYWERYIYLWIKYVVFEELTACDIERARKVYELLLNEVIPHRKFTFAKCWIFYAQFLIRNDKDLSAARKVLGQALGMCPKPKLFKFYVNLEYTLGNIDRVRKIYEKFLEYDPCDSAVWQSYAEMEAMLAETERARAIFEMAVAQPVLHQPERVWKAFIEMERTTARDRNRARSLYDRLLEKTNHTKVWLSYANFEYEPLPVPMDEEGSDGAPADDDAPLQTRVAKAREIFERGYQSLRRNSPEEKEGAVLLLEAWRAFEKQVLEALQAAGEPSPSTDALAKVDGLMPRRIKRKRRMADEEGFEEYYDYAFPDEVGGEAGNAAAGLKLLEAAYKWKRAKQDAGGGSNPGGM